MSPNWSFRLKDRANFGRRGATLHSAEIPGAKGNSARRALGQNALQRAAVHVELARGLRHVALAGFVDALDMLPAHAVGRHRMFGALRPVGMRPEVSAAVISSASTGLAR